MGKHKSVVCKTCYRVMRSDVLNRHMKLHVKYVVVEPLPSIASSLSYESNESIQSAATIKPNTSFDEEVLLKKMLQCEREYKDKMEMGGKMYEFVKEYDIDEKSIPKEMREPLEIYKEQKQNVDVENVILRSWQESLLYYMKPSDREVIWVQGRYCGEGKAWFQEYVESRYGFKRVVAGMDIKLKKSSICHVLRKRRLATTDIFLFDVGKAKTFDTVNYEVLEKIKNGRILASKFDSVELKLRTPNIVVVFSNDRPEVNQLAHDRWKIFSIENDDLVEKPIPHSKSKAKSNPKPETSDDNDRSNWFSTKKKQDNGDIYDYDEEKKSYTLISKPRSDDQKTYFCLEESDIESSASDEKKTHTNSCDAFEEVKKSEDIVEYPLDKPKSDNMQKRRAKITDYLKL